MMFIVLEREVGRLKRKCKSEDVWKGWGKRCRRLKRESGTGAGGGTISLSLSLLYIGSPRVLLAQTEDE